MKHQINHSQIDHSFTAGGQRLIVFAQPSVFAQPAKGTLHYPAFRQNLKIMKVATFNNLNDPIELLLRPFNKETTITTISPDNSQTHTTAAKPAQNQLAARMVLNVRSMNNQSNDQAKRINQNMSFSPGNPFSGVITAFPPFSAVFTLWLSIIPALGVGLRPAWRRTCSRRQS